jgi:hypothetical protein
MSKQLRQSIVVGLVISGPVGLLVKHEAELGGWMQVLTFLAIVALLIQKAEVK